MIFYPLLATLISAAFATTLFVQYRAKHRPYLLAWAVALAFYAIAALTEVIGAASGWNPLLYRTYYGATLQPGLLDTRQVPSVDTIRLERGSFNVVALIMAAVVNSVGTVILVGGAAWSAYGAWRHGAPSSRLVANILIAAGALIVAGASTLTRLFHVYELFYVGQAIGVLVMFGGFLAAQRAPRRAANLNPVASR